MNEPVLVTREFARRFLLEHPTGGLWFDYDNPEDRRWWLTPRVEDGQLAVGYLMPAIAVALVSELGMQKRLVEVKLQAPHKRRKVYAVNAACRQCGCTEDRACGSGCGWTLGSDGYPTNLCDDCSPFVSYPPA